MLHSQKGKEKKAAGSGEPTKETHFIHKVTHIHKNELRRQALPTASNRSPPQKKHPSKHLSLAPLHNQDLGSPRGPLPSENAVRSQIQREAPASLHPPPSAPIFFFSTIPRPRF